MREILFRGKRVGYSDWITGSLVIRPTRLSCLAVIVPFSKSKDDDVEVVDVDTSTVGQYTGLTDKSGKKIFEGDILKEDDVLHNGETQIKGRIGTCSFEKGCWVILFKDTWDFLQTNIKACSVVGNIHDNPELLKKKK